MIKRANRVLMAGVVFPAVEKYLSRYIESVLEQDFKDFDLLLINDGIADFGLPESVKSKLIENKDELSPLELRMKIISYAVENDYDCLIFSDCDDYYDKNRVSRTVEKLSICDIAVTQLSCVSENEESLEADILNKESFDCLDLKGLLKWNIIGMSHSAIRIDKELMKRVICPGDTLAFDWWFYSVLLAENKTVGFIPESRTYYRQFDLNFVGHKTKINEIRLKAGIRTKKIHYTNLSLYLRDNCNKYLLKNINDMYVEMELLEAELKDKAFLKKYIEVINENIDDIYRGWWSEILPLKKWSKYV